MDLSRRDFARTAVAGSLPPGTAGLAGRSIADDVVVMHDGSICEQGAVNDVLQAPKDSYTAQLRADAPKMTVAVDG